MILYPNQGLTAVSLADFADDLDLMGSLHRITQLLLTGLQDIFLILRLHYSTTQVKALRLFKLGDDQLIQLVLNVDIQLMGVSLLVDAKDDSITAQLLIQVTRVWFFFGAKI